MLPIASTRRERKRLTQKQARELRDILNHEGFDAEIMHMGDRKPAVHVFVTTEDAVRWGFKGFWYPEELEAWRIDTAEQKQQLTSEIERLCF